MKARKSKAIRILLCMMLLFWCWSIPAQATAPKVEINGTTLNFDVAPVIVDGRILVPIRAVFEAMGAAVSWEQATMTATAVKGSTTVVLQIGSLAPTINGTIKPIDVAGKIVDDRTLAPLRFVCEAFGGTVEWNADTQTAVVKIKQGLTVGEDKGF